jgi:hypothetical protein
MEGAMFVSSRQGTGMVVGGAHHGLAWTTDEEKHCGVVQVMILVSLVEGYSSYMVEFNKKIERNPFTFISIIKSIDLCSLMCL